MTLLVLSIPLMIVMVALAVVPLVVVSRAEHRSVSVEVRASADTPPEHVGTHTPEATLSHAA